MRGLPALLTALATPLLTLAALVLVAVGVSCKADMATAAIVVGAILLADVAVEGLRSKGSAQ